MKSEDIIVIPDVHGREFWKSIKDRPETIVFLGDYLDPYQIEGITEPMALNNFREILEFATSNKDRVHLLLGNHDLHYISLSDDSCRMDLENKKEISNLFINNKDLFNIAFKQNDALFTHAGVTSKWILSNPVLENINSTNVDVILNGLIHSVKWESPIIGFSSIRNYTNTPFGDIGYARGGYFNSFGSCVWADATEMYYHSAFYPELQQITGHTRLQKDETYIHPEESNWWMCDSRANFLWSNKNKNLELIKV